MVNNGSERGVRYRHGLSREPILHRRFASVVHLKLRDKMRWRPFIAAAPRLKYNSVAVFPARNWAFAQMFDVYPFGERLKLFSQFGSPFGCYGSSDCFHFLQF